MTEAHSIMPLSFRLWCPALVEEDEGTVSEEVAEAMLPSPSFSLGLFINPSAVAVVVAVAVAVGVPMAATPVRDAGKSLALNLL